LLLHHSGDIKVDLREILLMGPAHGKAEEFFLLTFNWQGHDAYYVFAFGITATFVTSGV